MKNEKKFIIIFLIAWIFPICFLYKQKCNLNHCKVCSGSICIQCFEGYTLSDNKCVLSRIYSKRSLSNSSSPTESNQIKCEIKNCISCYNVSFCKQCKDINYIVDSKGQCIHLCNHINCDTCEITPKDQSWIWSCKKCLAGFTMVSKKSIIYFN